MTFARLPGVVYRPGSGQGAAARDRVRMMKSVLVSVSPLMA